MAAIEMTPEERQQRCEEIERELEKLWARQVCADPAKREEEQLAEQDSLDDERTQWFDERDRRLRTVRILGNRGMPIVTLEGWLHEAPPQEANQWQEYRSAMECARAWLQDGTLVPAEIWTLLQSRPETRNFQFGDEFPEKVLRLDKFRGKHRHADIHALGRRGSRTLLLSVEAKAEESFGALIGTTHDKGTLVVGSNIPRRIESLVQSVFGRPLDSTIKTLRYQLLYGLAGPLIEAQREKADLVVFVVHEFLSNRLIQTNVNRNAADLQNFVAQIPGWQNQALQSGRLLPIIQLPGWPIPVTLGKVQTKLV